MKWFQPQLVPIQKVTSNTMIQSPLLKQDNFQLYLLWYVLMNSSQLTVFRFFWRNTNSCSRSHYQRHCKHWSNNAHNQVCCNPIRMNASNLNEGAKELELTCIEKVYVLQAYQCLQISQRSNLSICPNQPRLVLDTIHMIFLGYIWVQSNVKTVIKDGSTWKRRRNYV